VTTADSTSSRAIAYTPRGPIEYRLTGSGPAVLVLKRGHSSRDTRLGLERLAEHGFTVIDASRPGYDDTPPSVGCSAAGAADAMVGLLDALGVATASLVAISAAGHTGIELARRHPGRIERVSFEAAVALPWPAAIRLGGRLLFGRAQAAYWRAMRAGLRSVPSLALQFWLAQLSTLHPAKALRRMDAVTRRQYVAALASLSSGTGFLCDLTHDSPSPAPIGQPTLILHGAHDRAVRPAHADRLAALAKLHERVEIDAESHFIWFGRAAAEVFDRRLAFLRARAGRLPDAQPARLMALAESVGRPQAARQLEVRRHSTRSPRTHAR
jgi:pimeloyl-ACP methyl ester carboxylesterase